MLSAALVSLTSCSEADDTFEDINTPWNNGENTSGGGSSTTGELATFDIAIDTTSPEPDTSSTPYYPDEEDILQDNLFTTEVPIDMSNPVSTTVSGVHVTARAGHITADHGTVKNVCYILSGTTANGSFTVLGEKKYAVLLNGADITNPDSAALNLLSTKRAFVTLATGTTNTLADGTGGSHKGTLYAKGKLLFNGTGAFSVTANTNNAIHSADYIIFNPGNNIRVRSVANHGIKANDGIIINGGIINVEVSAPAAKGINSESHIFVNGGRTTVLTTGGGTYDSDLREAKAAAAIKADSTITVNGGELHLKSTGAGGKGISGDTQANINGGTIRVITTGTQYKSGADISSPKGIKTDGDISITGGTIWVRTSGTKAEGIETKGALTIAGGETASYAYDDAINASLDINITGGYIYAHGQNNDGIDANGNCYISGGTVYAVCSGSPEVAIDANSEQQKKLYLTGGTVVAVGGLENGSSLTQACYQTQSWSPTTWYALTVGTATLAFQTPSAGGSPLVVSGNTQPVLKSGITATAGTTHFGALAIDGATVTGGTTLTLSSYTGGSNGMGGGPGGSFPGGRR